MNNENNIAPINEDLNVVEYEIEDIKSLIYTIRGKQVMLDSDVARLYKYETKNVNKAMKRNIDRFPEDFCFQINDEEMNSLRFQNGTLKNQNGRGQHVKYLPYVYTEMEVHLQAYVTTRISNE